MHSQQDTLEECIVAYALATRSILHKFSNQREQFARHFIAMLDRLRPISSGTERWLLNQVSNDDIERRNAGLRMLIELASPVVLSQEFAHGSAALRALKPDNSTSLRLLQNRLLHHVENLDDLSIHDHKIEHQFPEILLTAVAGRDLLRVNGLEASIQSPDQVHRATLNSLLFALYRALIVEPIKHVVDSLRELDAVTLLEYAETIAYGHMYLSLLEGDRPEPGLTWLLNHPDPRVAVRGVWALALLGDPSCIGRTRQMLDSNDDMLVGYALDTSYILSSGHLLDVLVTLGKSQKPWDPDHGYRSVSGEAAAVINAITGIWVTSSNELELVPAAFDDVERFIDTWNLQLRYHEGEPLRPEHWRALMIDRHTMPREAGKWGLVSALGADEDYLPMFDLIYNIPALDRWDKRIASWRGRYQPGRWYYKGRLVK